MDCARDFSVEDPDVSADLSKYSEASVSLDSAEFKGWWAAVLESSSLVIRKTLDTDAWSYLIKILSEACVSGIEHLDLKLPDWMDQNTMTDLDRVCRDDLIEAGYQLGTVLATGRFSALKTLKILVHDFPVLLENHPFDEHLQKALRKGMFKNLQTLTLPSDPFDEHLQKALRKGMFKNLQTLTLPSSDVSKVLGSLIEGDIRRLTSLSIFKIRRPYAYNQAMCNVDTGLGSDNYFNSLQHVHLSHVFSDDWMTFTKLVIRGKLPRLTSLCLSGLNFFTLQDLVAGGPHWVNALENLTIDRCLIKSNQVCSLIDAVIQVPTPIAWKSLNFRGNLLDEITVDALISVANSGRLLQLQELDFSDNPGLISRSVNVNAPNSFRRLILSIQKGMLPSLRKLNWEGNKVFEADVKAIVQAYFENQALIAEIHITWHQVRDPSLKKKLKRYRDRNLRRITLWEELGEGLPLIPLTHAKVFLCGFAEVGKTTLRRTLFRKRTKIMWETRPIKEPRTRGIEISRIEAKESSEDTTTLYLWDLAGQEEYHVLHGTFLAGLGFEGGKATIFVLVFKASFESDLEDKLLYWLRFVASCSLEQVKRHVVIVLNCFKGRIPSQVEQQLWKGLIKSCAIKFTDSLDIRLDPFVMDVRKAAAAQLLKDHLFNQTRTSLQGVQVPRICFKLDEELKEWVEGEKKCPHSHFYLGSF